MKSLSFARGLKIVGFLLIALTTSTVLAGGGEWRWIEDKRDVQLWILKSPDDVLPGFRGQTKIRGTIDQIVQEMLDVRHHTEWMHRCAESWIYEHTAENRGILYNRTSSAPWPVWDRDVVLDVQFDYAADRKSLTVRFRNRNDLLRPVPERVVRIPRLVGFYKMTQIAPNLTNVLYQVEVDIGGSIPDWIAEQVSKDLPYYTLLSLRERVEGIQEESLPVAMDLPKPSDKTLRASND